MIPNKEIGFVLQNRLRIEDKETRSNLLGEQLSATRTEEGRSCGARAIGRRLGSLIAGFATPGQFVLYRAGY